MAVLFFAPPLSAQEMPKSFVYLRDVDPRIQQEMRYFGSHNFRGKPSKGYQAPECILARKTAEALKRAQDILDAEGLYTLKVYDCYRPVRAVSEFAAWSRNTADTKMKREFYPDLDKRNLFSLGYIAKRSVHSKGSAIDLTLVPKDAPPSPAHDVEKSPQTPCTAPVDQRAPDNSLDFGTGYDCFSELSHTKNAKIKGEARVNREKLVAVMTAAGFQNYRREWWHFEYPGGGTVAGQDFEILPHPEAAKPAVTPVLSPPLPASEVPAPKLAKKPRAEKEDAEQAALTPPPSQKQAVKATSSKASREKVCDENSPNKDKRATVLLACSVGNGDIRVHEKHDDASASETLGDPEQELECLECFGLRSLAAYSGLSPEDQAQEGTPWCRILIHPPTPATLPRKGWVLASQLRLAGIQCKEDFGPPP